MKTELFYFPFRKLHVELFGEHFTKNFEDHLGSRKNFTLFVAESLSGEILGFKSGYELNPSMYYSWSGGVTEKARRNGVAKALMLAQHGWCEKRGYKKVSTKTKNKFREMLVMNIKNGFDVVGTEPDAKILGDIKILLEKKL